MKPPKKHTNFPLMNQVAQHLPNKHRALNSNPSAIKNKNNKEMKINEKNSK
jgi:methionyl-tRNA formyltransferase